MIVASPVNPLAFRTPIPRVTLTDLRSDTSDLTVYTFSACQVNLGSSLSFADVTATSPYFTPPERNIILVAVHGEDAAATFGVSGVTLGGVSGLEVLDRGGAGAGVLVNTACYAWLTTNLQEITDTDIVVTFSEAVTSCAIAVISIPGGLTNPAVGGSGTATGAATLTLTNGGVTATETAKGLYFVFSTINASGEAFAFVADKATGQCSGAFPPVLLYESSNAEMGYAGAYCYYTGPTQAGALIATEWDLSWSGANNADAIATTAIRY